jgi:hypothetical protein
MSDNKELTIKIVRKPWTVVTPNIYWMRIYRWPKSTRFKSIWYLLAVFFFTLFALALLRCVFILVEDFTNIRWFMVCSVWAILFEVCWLVSLNSATRERERLVMRLVAQKVSAQIVSFSDARRSYLYFLFRKLPHEYLELSKHLQESAKVWPNEVPSFAKRLYDPDSKPRINALLICFMATVLTILARIPNLEDALGQIIDHKIPLLLCWVLVVTASFFLLWLAPELGSTLRFLMTSFELWFTKFRYRGDLTRKRLFADLELLYKPKLVSLVHENRRG